MFTVEHELKKHNYSFYSQSSNCIDEKMLDILQRSSARTWNDILKDRLRNLRLCLLKKVDSFTSSPKLTANMGALRENGGISIRLQLRTTSCVRLLNLQLVKKKNSMLLFWNLLNLLYVVAVMKAYESSTLQIPPFLILLASIIKMI